MHELRTGDRYPRRWLLLPETAPLLFHAGFDGREKHFQRAVVRLQMALEDICAQAANPNQVLLCHRGALDALAYWLRNGWDEDEFFVFTQTTRDEHFQRYFGVIHLQTAAIGAEAHYRRWPDAHRPETLEQAAETDYLCACAWRSHPRYILIDNTGRDWPDKMRAVSDLLTRWLTQMNK